MARVLVLRPEPGASATAERARQLGLDAIAAPLFVIEPVDWRAPDPARFEGLLLTSANGVRHAGPQLRSFLALPVYAVGAATAETARQAGFGIALVGDAGVERLLDSVDPEINLLHLCGADRQEHDRPKVTPVVVYRSCELEAPDFLHLPGGVALVHSPRAGRRLAELVQDRASTAIAAISEAAADAVGGGWREIAVVERPSDDALLALAARLCNNPDPK